MIQKTIKNFDIDKICYSGQCFRMRELDNGRYSVVASGKYLELSQKDEVVTFYCTKEEYDSLWNSYFDLDNDYEAINQLVTDDAYMQAAMEYGSGIRILKQDLWETLISFLISQQNNIPRIKKSIEELCRRYGDVCHSNEGSEYYTFPKPAALAELTEEELKECGLGYRAKYIARTAREVCEGIVDLNRIKELPYEAAKAEVLTVYGVGIKVAECICLYSLHHLEAFPVDTHIKKVVEKNYPEGFPFEKYKGYSGALQQYAFYYDLRPVNA